MGHPRRGAILIGLLIVLAALKIVSVVMAMQS